MQCLVWSWLLTEFLLSIEAPGIHGLSSHLERVIPPSSAVSLPIKWDWEHVHLTGKLWGLKCHTRTWPGRGTINCLTVLCPQLDADLLQMFDTHSVVFGSCMKSSLGISPSENPEGSLPLNTQPPLLPCPLPAYSAPTPGRRWPRGCWTWLSATKGTATSFTLFLGALTSCLQLPELRLPTSPVYWPQCEQDGTTPQKMSILGTLLAGTVFGEHYWHFMAWRQGCQAWSLVPAPEVPPAFYMCSWFSEQRT